MPHVLSESEWQARAAAHHARADAHLSPHLRRQARGERHPVLDFLFTYYSLRPAQLRRWHPGYGVLLHNAPEYARLRGYRAEGDLSTASQSYAARRAESLTFVASLLENTEAKPPQLGCFGLHEWAMVYGSDPVDVRHAGVPLRLGHRGTDEVVESLQLRCTHYDAFRFFTTPAAPRNTLQLTRADQLDREQPGCVHASMDLYKWCYKLLPLTDSELLLDCFELAIRARELDMRASPYDLSEFGYPPVRIETPAGRAEYVRGQQELRLAAGPLRARLLQRCREVLADLA
ncbi:3-methyladenine DNA glycosylase [Hoyosella sp. YIM 151337]|uniref:3-methyladenine DNA glycosylase n=1 Tax=Hoyosella sp. YIM 151337 TaxID=2992742 RepID=UPI0035A88B6C